MDYETQEETKARLRKRFKEKMEKEALEKSEALKGNEALEENESVNMG